MKKETAYFLLGSNVGDRIEHLAKARHLMNSLIGTITKTSKIYETAPWGFKKQGDFLNQAVVLETDLEPQQTLAIALKIQYMTKWEKGSKYGPRVMDIDLIFYNQEVIDSVDLMLPHPRMHKRNFVLIPLAEIAGEVVHPVLEMTVGELANVCEDREEVRLYVHNDD